MKKSDFFNRLSVLEKKLDSLLQLPNEKAFLGNGIFERYKNPVLTAQHAPLFWLYDLNPDTNPHLMERFGINAVLNAGAIKWNNKYLVVARVESSDRKSFFAIAESSNGIDNFRFWDYPIMMPETNVPDANIYDMRVVQHEDEAEQEEDDDVARHHVGEEADGEREGLGEEPEELDHEHQRPERDGDASGHEVRPVAHRALRRPTKQNQRAQDNSSHSGKARVVQ